MFQFVVQDTEKVPEEKKYEIPLTNGVTSVAH